MSDTVPDTKERKESSRKLFKLEDDGRKNNYYEYAMKNIANLEMLDLWTYIISDPPRIPKLVAPLQENITLDDGTTGVRTVKGNADEVEKKKKESEPWLKGNRAARALIINSLPGHRMYLVAETKTAKEAWNAVREEYQSANAERASTLRNLVASTRCTPDRDVNAWLADMTKIYMEVSILDPQTMPNTDFSRMLVDNMPDHKEWVSAATILRNERMKAEQARKPLSYQYVARQIKNLNWSLHRGEASELENLMPELNRVQTQSAVAPNRKRENQGPADRTSAKRSRLSNPNLSCTNKWCDRKQGHTAENCVSYMGGKQGQYWDGWTGPRDIHLAPHLRKKSDHSTGSNSRAAAAHSASLNDRNSNHSSIEPLIEITEALSGETPNNYRVHASTVICHPLALSITTSLTNYCYHDSGANRHIFHDRSAFTTYSSIAPIVCKGFESNISAIAVGAGDVILQLRFNNRSTKLTLKNCLHIPNARHNLISQICLDTIRIGATFPGDPNHRLFLSYDNKVITSGKANSDGSLYKLDCTIHSLPSSSLIERISPPSLHSRISPMGVALDALNAYTAYSGPVKSDFYTGSLDTSVSEDSRKPSKE
jgi:hypothetical protein